MRLAGLLIVKMGVRAKIRAVAGGAPLEVHRAHEIALHERFEAVVNRREGDGGQSGFYAGEHFVGSGVVAFPEQNIVDDFSLRGRAQAAVGELLCEGFSVVGLFGTVWGIYNALVKIGMSGQASIDKVAGPVGESLIMTAIGLAVAVPAVLGYNWLVRRNKAIMEDVNAFGSDLHSVLLASSNK